MYNQAQRMRRYRQKLNYEKKIFAVPDFLRHFFKLSRGWTEDEMKLKKENIEKYFADVQKNNADTRRADNVLATITTGEQAVSLLNGLILRGLQMGFIPLWTKIFLPNMYLDQRDLKSLIRKIKSKCTIDQIEHIKNELEKELK